MRREEYDRFTQELRARLEGDPRVLGLVALGSMSGEPPPARRPAAARLPGPARAGHAEARLGRAERALGQAADLADRRELRLGLVGVRGIRPARRPFALHDASWIAIVGQSAGHFREDYVDRRRPAREVVPSITRLGAWASSWGDASTAKCNEWKNGFHSAEHALVMDLFSRWLLKSSAPLYFAFPAAEVAARAKDARPYTFLGRVASVEDPGSARHRSRAPQSARQLRSTPVTRAFALAVVLPVFACNGGGSGAVFTGGDYQVGTLHLHVASGVAVVSGGFLTLVLSDQPNTCDALSFVPRQRWARLSLKVAPTSAGATRATIVPLKPSPAAGEAVGSISESTGGIAGASYDAASGSIAWTPHSDGSVTIDTLDAGFSGPPDRVTAAGLTVPGC